MDRPLVPDAPSHSHSCVFDQRLAIFRIKRPTNRSASALHRATENRRHITLMVRTCVYLSLGAGAVRPCEPDQLPMSRDGKALLARSHQSVPSSSLIRHLVNLMPSALSAFRTAGRDATRACTIRGAVDRQFDQYSRRLEFIESVFLSPELGLKRIRPPGSRDRRVSRATVARWVGGRQTGLSSLVLMAAFAGSDGWSLATRSR